MDLPQDEPEPPVNGKTSKKEYNLPILELIIIIVIIVVVILIIFFFIKKKKQSDEVELPQQTILGTQAQTVTTQQYPEKQYQQLHQPENQYMPITPTFQKLVQQPEQIQLQEKNKEQQINEFVQPEPIEVTQPQPQVSEIPETPQQENTIPLQQKFTQEQTIQHELEHNNPTDQETDEPQPETQKENQDNSPP